MDPLAELVKIDPKSIGVGQYQHDVDQLRLKESLDLTVMSCVNSVGINLNTASKHLLMYVSGLGPTLSQNIVKYREEKGWFYLQTTTKKYQGWETKLLSNVPDFKDQGRLPTRLTIQPCIRVVRCGFKNGKKIWVWRLKSGGRPCASKKINLAAYVTKDGFTYPSRHHQRTGETGLGSKG